MGSNKSQGYGFVLLTMLIWGSFSIISRLNAQWHISAWDITALRLGIAVMVLLPILIYRRDLAFLARTETVILALFGGVAYCLTVYSAFLYAPVAHCAIFLNGCIPLCTALAAYVLYRQPFNRHLWLSLILMLCSLALMLYLLSLDQHHPLGIGDALFVLGALWWGIFTALLRRSQLSAWQLMSGVAIWSAILYLPIYLLFLPKQLLQNSLPLLLLQGGFHGILVVIVATLSYVEAVKRLGAFKAGSLVTLAPFLSAVLAVPLLQEPLQPAIMVGLLGMGLGALQPWRWFGTDLPA
jgi:drug/metabolite transporter (DMT)-like permease